MRNLDELRDKPLVGEVAFRIDATTLRPLLFHDFAHTAYYLTVDALRNFEMSDAIGPGPFVVPAIAFWFMAAESYISTIYKTCSVIDDMLRTAGHTSMTRPRLRKTTKVVEKMGAIKNWMAPGSPPDPPRKRLHEFATFRNALLHDLTTHAPKTHYAHTSFAPHAEQCNQADLVEALNVSLEVFAYFRFVFRGADLMPSISLGATVAKLDALADEVLYSAYNEVLAAKGLTSAVGPTERNACPAELRIVMQFLICHDGPVAPTARAGSDELIVDTHQDAAIHARPVSADKFCIPDYTR